jgi:hypothetical protein
LIGTPERKRLLGRPRRMWEDNIWMNLKEIGWGGVNLIDLAQDRDQWKAIVNTVMNLRGPEKLRNSWVSVQVEASQEGLSCMELVS